MGKCLMSSGMNGNIGNQIVETAAMLDIQQKKEKKRKEKEQPKTPEHSQPAFSDKGQNVGDGGVRLLHQLKLLH